MFTTNVRWLIKTMLEFLAILFPEYNILFPQEYILFPQPQVFVDRTLPLFLEHRFLFM
jgi:hypothetical protein